MSRPGWCGPVIGRCVAAIGGCGPRTLSSPVRPPRPPISWVAVSERGEPGRFEGAEYEEPAMGGRRQHVRDQGAISEHLDRLGMSIDEGLVETGLIHHTLDLVEKGTSCSVKARSHRFDRLQVLDPTSGRRARRSRSSTCPSRRSDGRGEIAGGVIVDTREGEHDVSIQNSSRDPKATWWMEMHIVFRGE